jgi:hypothetical protein
MDEAFFGGYKNILKCNLFFGHHFPEVDKAITHSSQGCINAAFGKRGYFFEAQVCVVAHNDHYSLVFR